MKGFLFFVKILLLSAALTVASSMQQMTDCIDNLVLLFIVDSY